MTNPTIKCENIHEFWRGFRPSEGSSFPTVILLHGSEGSMSGWIYKQAMFLAAHGYLAIPFGYSKDSTFWDAGSIREVELSETSNALSAIRKHPFCSGKICLYGISRGAEHALLLASLMAAENMTDQANSIAVHAPADITYCAFDSRCMRAEEDPSWKKWDWNDNAWLWKSDASLTKSGTQIEIEHYKNPIFISHGKKDTVWDCSMTEKIEQRLNDAGRAPEVHYFENEGHGFSTEGENNFNALLLDFLKRTIH